MWVDWSFIKGNKLQCLKPIFQARKQDWKYKLRCCRGGKAREKVISRNTPTCMVPSKKERDLYTIVLYTAAGDERLGG